MKYTKLGNTGMDVSKICLGMMSFGKPGKENGLFPWALEFEDAKPIFKKAIDLGINFFDTANVYQLGTSEEVTGKLIKEFGLDRDDIVVASKVRMEMRPGKLNGSGLSRKEIMSEIDKSLKRLQLDYIDLYQIHRLDPLTPMEEIMEALHDVVKAGKARYIGASSMYSWQFLKALHIAEKNNWTRFVSMQNHLNLLYREEEREMLPLCKDEKIGVIPWSPMARGKLTRNWDETTYRSETDEFGKHLYAATSEADRKVVERVAEVAEKRGVPRAQIALAWVLQKETITAPIIGATKMHHLDDAVAALSITLTAEEVSFLEEPYVPHQVLGFK